MINLAKLQRMITSIIFNQIHFLPTLLLSHYLYGKTEWTLKQIVGVLILVSGTLTYSLSRVLCPQNEKKNIGTEDNEVIISTGKKKLQDLDQESNVTDMHRDSQFEMTLSDFESAKT